MTPLGRCHCWWTFRSRWYYQPNSQHFCVDMNINNVVIFINFLFTKLWIFRKTKDFLIIGIDYLSRIWHHFLEFWILNALQLCSCLALWIFWYEHHWWVWCRRNARLAYLIIILVPLITIYSAFVFLNSCTCIVSMYIFVCFCCTSVFLLFRFSSYYNWIRQTRILST